MTDEMRPMTDEEWEREVWEHFASMQAFGAGVDKEEVDTSAIDKARKRVKQQLGYKDTDNPDKVEITAFWRALQITLICLQFAI